MVATELKNFFRFLIRLATDSHGLDAAESTALNSSSQSIDDRLVESGSTNFFSKLLEFTES